MCHSFRESLEKVLLQQKTLLLKWICVYVFYIFTILSISQCEIYFIIL